jgi:aerobic-type carbon monoxide dehydrogenase small subunit (CoxS/CutS family)
MADGLEIKVNGRMQPVSASPDTPLLYVLTNELQLCGPRFGCGLAQCGSCSVLADGVEIRSCITPVAAVTNKSITTFEGLAVWYAERKGLAHPPALHPLQQAFIDVQAIHCGYCYNGMTVKGAELLAHNPHPTEADIRQTMNGHLCRCGTYPRVLKAIQLAAQTMAAATP